MISVAMSGRIFNKHKVLTLYFGNVEYVHLGKDVFLVPYYLGKELGCHVRIIYPMTFTNKNLPRFYRGAELIPLSYKGNPIKNKLLKLFVFVYFYIKYVLPSDVFMLFHYYYLRNIQLGVVYKLLHPKGKLYLKMDASIIALKDEDNYKNFIIKKYNDIWHVLFALLVDCITCETKACYEKILNSSSSSYRFRRQLFVMPNAFDDEALEELNISIKSFKEKKNQFITVSRIDDPGKNTEMLLQALGRVDLKDWSFIIVGPYDSMYNNRIEDFFVQNPDKKENVLFTGSISDKSQLWKLYNESKVLVFTSRYESCGLIFVEGNMFHNYILSTDVGAFSDVVKDGKYGESVPQDSFVDLASKMQSIIDGVVDINRYSLDDWGLKWSDVIKPVADKLRNCSNNR